MHVLRIMLILSSISLPLYSSAPSAAAAQQNDPIQEKYFSMLNKHLIIGEKILQAQLEANAVAAKSLQTQLDANAINEKRLKAQLDANAINENNAGSFAEFVRIFAFIAKAPPAAPAAEPSATSDTNVFMAMPTIPEFPPKDHKSTK